MLSVLATGTLLRDPQQRASAAGKPYCTALLRVPTDGEDAMLCSLIAFNADAVRAILALGKGDALSVTGRAKLTSWEKDGTQHHGMSVTVEQVLTPYLIAKRSRDRGQVTENATHEAGA